jgi:hypothetical protein
MPPYGPLRGRAGGTRPPTRAAGPTWAAGRGDADVGNGLFLEPAPGREQGVRWLIGWLRLDGLTTTRAEAVLPPIPALKSCVTTQAGGGASISSGFLGFPASASPIHGGPQRFTADVGVEITPQARS